MNEDKLGEILIKLGAINALDLVKAAQHQKKENCSLSSALIAVKAVTAVEMGRIAATMIKMPFVSLRAVSVPPEMVKLLPEGVAQKYRGIPLKAEGKKFWVAMSQPTNMDCIDALRFRLNGDVYPVVTPESEMDQALEFYYGNRKNEPLRLPPSTGIDYIPESFDIRKARAAQAAPAPQRPAAPPPAAAPAAAASAPAPSAPPPPTPVASPPPAPVSAPPQAAAPAVEPLAVEEPVLELIEEPAGAQPAAPATAATALFNVSEAAPSAESAQSEQPSDAELMNQLANFLLGK
jgi:hypothetical protein